MELPEWPARRGWRGGGLGEGPCVSVRVVFSRWEEGSGVSVNQEEEAGGGWVRETCWDGALEQR